MNGRRPESADRVLVAEFVVDGERLARALMARDPLTEEGAAAHEEARRLRAVIATLTNLPHMAGAVRRVRFERYAAAHLAGADGMTEFVAGAARHSGAGRRSIWRWLAEVPRLPSGGSRRLTR